MKRALELVKAPPISEAQFERQVTDLIHTFQWWSFHIRDSRTVTSAGWPDWVFIRPPRILFVELKRQAGRVSPAQKTVLRLMHACGLEVAVWRPSDIDAIRDTLAPNGRRAELVL